MDAVLPQQFIPETTPSFQAEWPKSLDPKLTPLYQKVAKVAMATLYYLGWIVLLPLWWPSLKNKIFSELILPARRLEPLFDYDNFEDICQSDPFRNQALEHVSYNTPDHASIEGIFLPGSTRRHKVALCLLGNGAMWNTYGINALHNAGNPIKLLKDAGFSIMMINPRTVGESQGEISIQGLSLDVYSAFEYLVHEKGIDPNDIIIYGHSMGGAYGALGAALVQEKYPEAQIKAINDRSFLTLSKVAQSFVKTERIICALDLMGMMNRVLSYLVPFFSFFLKSLAPLVVKCSRLEMNIKAAWEKIKGPKLIITAQEDGIILPNARLSDAWEDKRSVLQLAPSEEAYSPFEEHLRPLKPSEQNGFVQYLQRV